MLIDSLVNRTVMLTVAAAMLLMPAAVKGSEKSKPAGSTVVVLASRRFNLANKADLDSFKWTVRDIEAVAKTERKDKGAKPAKVSRNERSGSPYGNRDWSSSKVRHGLKAMGRIAEDIQTGKVGKSKGIHDIQEIDWALEHNYVTPYTWRSSVDPLAELFRARSVTLNACGRGSRVHPATNLTSYSAPDLSKVDPKPSSFWARPASISEKDLYYGYDRALTPDFAASLCTYEKPHSGYGVHPSFEVTWHGTAWKVKFGEEKSSGPFASRIFWALGYPTEIVDYTPEVKVKYDRRILTDFNARRLDAMKMKVLGLTVADLHPTMYFSPFDFIQYAVMKDGSQVNSLELRHVLFVNGAGKYARPETRSFLYAHEFENRIDYFVMNDASFTSKENVGIDDLGFWDYNSLGHQSLREVRALALINGWIGNWDIRWGNNQLDLVETSNGGYRLQNSISDIGALFGNSTGMVRVVNRKVKYGLYQNQPNDFTWTFTHPQSPKSTSVPICNYMPITKTEPFYWMNLDDARWGARLIGQLSEAQIKQALIGAGYDGAEARLLLEKLVCRRDEMIRDLGLSREIPPLRPAGINRNIVYNPRTDGPIAVRAEGRTVLARNTGMYVVASGKLISADKAASARTAKNR